MATAPPPLWIFAYGSLMWRPDFAFAERHRASLEGLHRALCIWSHHYRGTAAVPGLVFGLAPAGACVGVAFRVAPGQEDAALAAVRERELVTNVYREIVEPVVLADGRSVEAVAYAADTAHGQYAGLLDDATILRTVASARGISGSNHAYVTSTYAHLLDLGVEDAGLAALCAALGSPAS